MGWRWRYVRRTAAGPVFVALGLSGCGDDRALDPYHAHCRAALGWVYKGVTEVTVADVREWESGDSRFVAVHYNALSGQGTKVVARTVRDIIQCQYPRRRTGDANAVRATAVALRGRPLSAEQVRTINVTISLAGGPMAAGRER